jgi:hypothetical protein
MCQVALLNSLLYTECDSEDPLLQRNREDIDDEGSPANRDHISSVSVLQLLKAPQLRHPPNIVCLLMISQQESGTLVAVLAIQYTGHVYYL